MYTYADLENRSGTIYNKKTTKGYSDPTALAGDLGILPHQIDWTKIGAYQAPAAPATPAPNLGTMTNEQYLSGGYYGGQQTTPTPIPKPATVAPAYVPYSQLENRNETIYNKQTGQGYSDPTALSTAMGISSNQIDWTKINKSTDYWKEGLPEGSMLTEGTSQQSKYLKKVGGNWVEFTNSSYSTPVGTGQGAGDVPVSGTGQQKTLIDIANSRPVVLNTAKSQGGDPFTAGTAANQWLNNWWNSAGKNEYPGTTLTQPSIGAPGAGQGATGPGTGAGTGATGATTDPNDPRAVLANALKEQGVLMQKYFDTLKAQPTAADLFKQYSDQLGIGAKGAQQTGLMSQINKTEQTLNDLEKNITSRITELGEGMSEAQRARQYATEKKQPMEDYTNLVKAYNQGEVSLSQARTQLGEMMKYGLADQEKQAGLAAMPLEYSQKMLSTMMSAAEYQSPAEKLAAKIAEERAMKAEGLGTYKPSKTTTPGDPVSTALGISAKDVAAFNTAFQDVYEKVLSGTNAINTREKAGQAMVIKYPKYADAIWKLIYGKEDEGIKAVFPDGYESQIKQPQASTTITEGKRKVIGAIETSKAANESIEKINQRIREAGYLPEDFAEYLSGYQTGSSQAKTKPFSFMNLTQFGSLNK